ncbi:UDP binding domain-containing protein [Streptomyces sp. NPDC058655]|uniref:UDP binding domain-containing protein n=1 Tax=Streptomyces sp. NPDC058655 TaxID=3346577 RepID=UPI003663B2D6
MEGLCPDMLALYGDGPVAQLEKESLDDAGDAYAGRLDGPEAYAAIFPMEEEDEDGEGGGGGGGGRKSGGKKRAAAQPGPAMPEPTKPRARTLAERVQAVMEDAAPLRGGRHHRPAPARRRPGGRRDGAGPRAPDPRRFHRKGGTVRRAGVDGVGAGSGQPVHGRAARDAARRLPAELDYTDDLPASVDGADLVVLATEWPEYGQADPQDLAGRAAGRLLVDCRITLDPQPWRTASWTVRQLGRPGK